LNVENPIGSSRIVGSACGFHFYYGLIGKDGKDGKDAVIAAIRDLAVAVKN